MSKNLDCSTSIYNKVGPDFFAFYSSEVAQLLSRDEGRVPSSLSTSHLVGNLNDEVEKANALFSNGIGALLVDSQKERLKSLLHQSVSTLTKEVDEMIDPILSICRIQSCLKCKDQLLSFDASSCKKDETQQSRKKLKRECSNQLKNGPVVNSVVIDDKECVEIDDDLRFLLESDSTKVEQLVKNQSNEFRVTLDHMEQKLEELLNVSMTSCRPMTIAEKLQLRKLIQSLPLQNLDQVVELIRNAEKLLDDEVHVDLDGLDNVTLWRLYSYVATVRGIAA